MFAVSAEPLPDGAGAGDFDARLIVSSGPSRVGETIAIGGVADIEIGKLQGKHIQLAGTLVSRSHCKLVRIDFGPSRWRIEDLNSSNGLFVNGSRVTTHELKTGDVIDIGDFEIRYAVSAPQQMPTPAAPIVKPAICPSCEKELPINAKICTDCGINLASGRSIVVSKGIDENDLAVRADTWIKVVSIIMPFGLFPVASEAFGTKKPITAFVIAGITVVCSIVFLIAYMSNRNDPSITLLNMMHWTGDPEILGRLRTKSQRELEDKIREIQSQARKSHQANAHKELSDKEIHVLVSESFEKEPLMTVGFHWYQLFTSALIHDPSGIFRFIYHLGGNMVFFFVFGLRVNELVGNWKMAILYPLLCVGSGLIDQFVHRHDPLMPGLGASGAIMGLAGMYFVFFPMQRVHMAIWLRIWVQFRTWLGYKLFTMRGFWLLVLWIGFNDILPVAFGWKDHVGHWAHLGGFMTGAAIALLLLVSRQVNAHGGDILSVALGRHAWALIGKPTIRKEDPASVLASKVISMNYPE